MFTELQKLHFEHREERPKVLNNTFERTHNDERVGLSFPTPRNAARWERREDWERRESLIHILEKEMLLDRAKEFSIYDKIRHDLFPTSHCTQRVQHAYICSLTGKMATGKL